MMELPFLKSPRCVLDHMSEGDIPVLRLIFDDESTCKYLSELRSLVRTDEGIIRMLASFDALQMQNEGMIWGVRLNGNLIAFVAFIDLSYNPTIIYAMHPAYRCKGYMKECVALSVRFVLDLGLCSYVQTEVHNDNTFSLHLLASIGFKVIMQDDIKTHLRMDIC